MQTNQLQGTLTVSTDRFPFIKEELGDKVEILKEYEVDGREYTQFYVKVDSILDLLFFFHAGVSCGCKEMAF
jgi:hypothetical protein